LGVASPPERGDDLAVIDRDDALRTFGQWLDGVDHGVDRGAHDLDHPTFAEQEARVRAALDGLTEATLARCPALLRSKARSANLQSAWWHVLDEVSAARGPRT
jgi:hypothetical protein